MIRKMVIVAVSLVVLYVGLCALLFVKQRSMIYMPRPGSQDRGAPKLTLLSKDAAVLVSTRPHEGADAVIYFGGNAEDVSYTLPWLDTAFPDHAVFLMHYRGYGGSTGTPSETGLFADAVALFDEVHAHHERVAVIGRSLGSAVAVYLASVRPVSRLVLVTPFDSLRELAAGFYPYFPVRWLILDKYESWRYAERVTAPTVLVSAELDEIVPRRRTEALLAHFRSGVATLTVLAGSGHNSISDSSEYWAALRGEP